MDAEQRIRTAYQTIERSLTPAPGASQGLQRAVAKRRQRRTAVAGLSVATAVIATAASVAAVQALGGSGAQRQPNVADGRSATPETTASPLTSGEEWQAEISPYENRLFAVAEQDPNYSGGELVFERREIIVYGTGEPSAEVAALLSESPEGTTASWVAVPYSKTELELAADRLSEVIPGAISIRYVENYSRILVGVDGLPRAGPELEELRDIAAEVTSIPVGLEDQPPFDSGPFVPDTD